MVSFATFKTPLLLLTMATGFITAAATRSNPAEHKKTPPKRRPNVIVILADDLGYSDLHAYGNEVIKTPNIDALGKAGTRFTHAFSTAAICSPSRAGLMTGRYQQRFGFEYLVPQNGGQTTAAQQRALAARLQNRNGTIEKLDISEAEFEKLPKGLPATEISLGQLFHDQGYKTAIIGKWHLGEKEGYYPRQRGFDYHYGFYSGLTMYAPEKTPGVVDWHLPWAMSEVAAWHRNGSNRLVRNNEDVNEQQYLTDKLADEAIQYITANKDQPFLLYLPFNAPHDPFQAKQEDFDLYPQVKDTTKRVYYGMITALDRAVGRIRQQLKALHLEDETILFFTSDNGGATYTRATDNKPLKGGKLSDFDGGIRIPFYVVYPGKVPGGKEFRQPVSNLDIYTTAAAAAGIALPKERVYDGVNLLPFVGARQTAAPHEVLYWRSGYSKAILKGDYKLYVNERSRQTFLYNVKEDIAEQKDLSATYPDKLAALKADLAKWESQVKQPVWPNRYSYALEVDGALYPFPI
ncbi:sulfatase-like hydrolase/transferase [Chitinophaga nivalis]|uniref:Sulfatase-like hydrolase/transferase n=1 Tax=Chitinophaga nivalis TaxID=2991709 RepID=A0ABT3IEC4_9BACT|nr:sulfatase-like hydrolase/transferase [Chitinophaga nivalis]MCW3468001.1 sulfatase-like hydrolase/transferase [Chitinophaga nivalis]MCW3482308.1 sulfatase-like hydrolase/transferase [Chitinophaga nivalis]